MQLARHLPSILELKNDVGFAFDDNLLNFFRADLREVFGAGFAPAG
jgi:hypothetical protein